MTGALAWLGGLVGFDALEHPLRFVGLLLLAALLVLRALRTTPPGVAWPAVDELAAAGGRHFDTGRTVALALRFAALAALALALAGPVATFRGPPEAGFGKDVVLVVDTSGSMRALDAEVGGAWRTRLELAREVVARFAKARAEAGDRVGLVVFGEQAFTQSPLSSDGVILAGALDRIEAGMAGEATALGDALALAVRRVAGAAPIAGGEGARSADVAPGAPAEGRLVVLLTDGRSNAGEVPTDVAAGLARTLGIRVHVVGIGAEGAVPMAAPAGSPRGGLRFERHDLDRDTLAGIARNTGGRFFHARRAQDLEHVYAEIDALERVPRRPPPRLRRDAHPEPALALAGGFLVLELVLHRALRRRLP